MVRLVRESFARVAPQADRVAEYFYATLFAIAPATREMFPVNMQVQRSRLLRALVHFVQMVDRPDELVPFLRQLGRDHRKFGVVASHYEAVGMALLAAVKQFAKEAWTDEVERAWAEAYTIMARAMLEAASADDDPAWWPATVLDRHRITRDLAVIRVRTEFPLAYHPGQYVSVETPQRPRMWRYLSPATAPREDGMLEFHVRSVEGGWVSRAMVGYSEPGDRWRIGPPMGRLRVDRHSGRDVLMVAGGTGIAPMRAIIDHLAKWGENPRVQLFFGGRVRSDLYDLENLHALAASNPWLTLVPVLESDHAYGAEQGTLADVVTRYGAWEDHDVLVSGSPAMVRSTVSRMLVAGTPLDRITYDPFTLD
ncbi:globin domain-containing protein [Actinophytocola xanthii]|uniref:nitric oxide dioxygenase n=1 Tax=Actinophytocola xanthii TaxID=1912961 RepID=A0A1Q8BSR2_9PSEU|nr:globin domain-containing protein [Actinophytocola xanthii]OLF05158.1 flavohemoprotein [Actinophytocola xanthii]OLF18378.1 flavohemoprotein [Actinophytocola xanthii]